MNANFVHHIDASFENLFSSQVGGRFFFVPGSGDRARKIADNFEDLKTYPSERGHDVFTGRLRFGQRFVDVGCVSTGMGCPSVDIIVNELIFLGISRFLRIGTAGTLNPRIVKPGDTVIATAAVRDESTSSAYASPSVPATASYILTNCLIRASQEVATEFDVHAGLVHSKDAFFAREHKIGPRGDLNKEYMQHLKKLGILATEMESSHLYILAQVNSEGGFKIDNKEMFQQKFLAGSILAIVGDEERFATKKIYDAAVEQAILIGLKSVGKLYKNGSR